CADCMSIKQLSVKRGLTMKQVFFFFQAEDGIRDGHVTGVQRVLFRSKCFFRRWARRGLLLSVQKTTKSSPRVIPPRMFSIFSKRSEERRVGKECRFRSLEIHKRIKNR